MVIEYIFIQKEESPIEEAEGKYGLFPKFCLFLEKVFINLTKDTFDVEYKKKIYTINYTCANCRSGEQSEYPMCYFEVTTDHKIKERRAEVLDFVKQIILDHEEKSKYTVINSYDGVSKYYCDRAFPKLNELERKIRSLIFRLLTKDFGEEWVNETMTVEQRNELKGKLRCKPERLKEQKLIEEAPYAMDINQLEFFLFAPTRHIPIEKLLDEEFTDEKLKQLSKEELLSIISNLKPRSVWEKCFKDQVSIENLQQKLNDIRIFRNMVAHSKFFYKKDYDKAVKIIVDLLQQIEVAIYDVSINKYEPLSLQDKVFGLSSALANVSLKVGGFGEIPDLVADYGIKISEIKDMIQGAFTTPLSNIVSQFTELGSGLASLAIPSYEGLKLSAQLLESMSSASNIEPMLKSLNETVSAFSVELMSNQAINNIAIAQNSITDTPMSKYLESLRQANLFPFQDADCDNKEIDVDESDNDGES